MAGAWGESPVGPVPAPPPPRGNALGARTERMPAGTLGSDKDHRTQGWSPLLSSPPTWPSPMEPGHGSPSPFSPLRLPPASSLRPQMRC